MLFHDDARGSTVSSPARVPTPISPRAGAETQRALLAYCEETLGGECEIEQVCCGSGIVRVYDFLRTYRAGGEEKPDLDPAGVTDAALDGTCDLCVEAVDIFLRILGAEAANLALMPGERWRVRGGGYPPRLMKIIGSGGKLLDGYLHKACRYAGVRGGSRCTSSSTIRSDSRGEGVRHAPAVRDACRGQMRTAARFIINTFFRRPSHTLEAPRPRARAPFESCMRGVATVPSVARVAHATRARAACGRQGWRA